MDINAAVGGKAGLSQEKIEAELGTRESRNLSERERIALEYADRVSDTPVDVADDFFATLRALFSEREIVELTAHIAHENYNAKSNRPLRGVGIVTSWLKETYWMLLEGYCEAGSEP